MDPTWEDSLGETQALGGARKAAFIDAEIH